MNSSKYDGYDYIPMYTQADADSWIHLHEEQRDEIASLRADLEQVSAERDKYKAIAEIPHKCYNCKFRNITGCVFLTKDYCQNNDKWQWRETAKEARGDE